MTARTALQKAFKISIHPESRRDTIPSGLLQEAAFCGRQVQMQDDTTAIVTWGDDREPSKADVAALKAVVTKYSGCTIKALEL
jgi:hypothetical protein